MKISFKVRSWLVNFQFIEKFKELKETLKKVIENIISHATSVSDMLEIAILLKEVGLAIVNRRKEFCVLQIVTFRNGGGFGSGT